MKYVQHFLRTTAVLLLAGCICICGGPGGASLLQTDFAYADETGVTNMTPEEVLVAAADPAALGSIYVYAPTIYALDSRYLVFGNGIGLVVYDVSKEKVSGLIDMQTIDAIYYNCETMKTHVILQGENDLMIYNTKLVQMQDNNVDEEERTDEVKYLDEEPFGTFARFDLSKMKGDGSLLVPAETGNDKARLTELMEKGAEYETEHFIDTWDNIAYVSNPEMANSDDYYNSSYSEKAFVHKGKDGKEYRSILFAKGMKYDDNGAVAGGDPFEYSLLSESTEGAKDTVYDLKLGITDEMRTRVKELNKLPAYTYNGDDEAVKTICEALARDDYGWHGERESGSVVLPVPVVFDKVKKNGELLVFGNFWSETYIRQGNTLIATSGGEMPACYHLKAEKGGGYTIVSADIAEDGEGYMESIAKFTEGFPKVYEKFADEEDYDENVKRDTLRSYCETNKLNIKYCKDYGCDPIDLWQ